MTPLILIADDDPGVRQVLAIQFADAGYRVVEAADGREALRLYRQERPHVLLTDLRMPHKDGQAVLEAVLAEDPQATVVVMTAYASVHGAVEVMKAGAFDFITKPFREEQVLATVERALEVARLKRENQRLRDALTTARGAPITSSASPARSSGGCCPRRPPTSRPWTASGGVSRRGRWGATTTTSSTSARAAWAWS